MNVTFHALASISTAATLSALGPGNEKRHRPERVQPIWLVAGFLIGIGVHGLLDTLPHAYPLPSAMDVVLALLLFGTALLLTRRKHWLLLTACFVGAIFPDLLDLGPAIINKRVGISLPGFKLFPWHWKVYSGSIYDGSRRLESALYHLFVIVISLSLLLRFRRSLLKLGENPGQSRDRF